MTDFTGSTALLNNIPAGRIDPNAVKLLGVYPAQNQPGFANNFVNLVKQPQDTNSYDIRIDENYQREQQLFLVCSAKAGLQERFHPACLAWL